MFIKFYKYRVKVNDFDKVRAIQKKARAVYQSYGDTSQYNVMWNKVNADNIDFIEQNFYQTKSEFEDIRKQVDADLKVIEMYDNFLNLVIKEEIIEEEFETESQKRLHTPELDTPEKKKKYIEKHLNDALRYLFTAATEWRIQNHLKLELVGYEVQVYSMDSTFLRARTLFEFFTHKTTDWYYGYDEFNINKIASSIYEKDWKDGMHAFAIHAQGWSNPKKLKALNGDKMDLNMTPFEIAKEIYRMWNIFIKELSDKELKYVAQKSLKDALAASKNTENSMKERPINCSKHEIVKKMSVYGPVVWE